MEPITFILVFAAGALSVPVSRFTGEYIVKIINRVKAHRAVSKMLATCPKCGNHNFKLYFTKDYSLMKIECAECGFTLKGRPKNVLNDWNKEVSENEEAKEGDCSANV